MALHFRIYSYIFYKNKAIANYFNYIYYNTINDSAAFIKIRSISWIINQLPVRCRTLSAKTMS